MKPIIVRHQIKVVRYYIPPNIPEGFKEAVEKQKQQLEQLIAKRKKMIAEWKEQKEKKGDESK